MSLTILIPKQRVSVAVKQAPIVLIILILLVIIIIIRLIMCSFTCYFSRLKHTTHYKAKNQNTVKQTRAHLHKHNTYTNTTHTRTLTRAHAHTLTPPPDHHPSHPHTGVGLGANLRQIRMAGSVLAKPFVQQTASD